MPLEFSPVCLDGQQDYLDLLKTCPSRASEYGFVNIFGWGPQYGLEWAFDRDLAWLRQTLPRPVYWAPVGPWDKVDWDKILTGLFPHGAKFIRVPCELAETWKTSLGPAVRVEDARDHWDYLYSVSELIELSGNRFHKKKNLFNQFVKKNEYVYMPMGPECVEQALEMQDAWCDWRDCEQNGLLMAENEAIYRVLQNFDRLTGIMGGVIHVDGKIAAYTVGESLCEDTVIIHFEKADTRYKGAYQAINQVFLANEAARFKYVNREQDLGDEGLRKAKLSYNPLDFVKKCRVSF